MFQIESMKSKIDEIIFNVTKETRKWIIERNETYNLLNLIFNKHKNKVEDMNKKVRILTLLLYC